MPISSSNVSQPIELSRQEMCIISRNISRDFAPRLFAGQAGRGANSRFTPRELLEISRQISREYAPNKVSHQAGLVLLAVSPRRLHVYWHLAKRRMTESPSPPETAEPMTLRIYAYAETRPTPAEPIWFDVKVDSQDGRRDVWVPEALADASAIRYRAALGDMADDRLFTPRVFSNAALPPPAIKQARREELPDAMVPYIMPALNAASSAGKTASGQGK